MAGVHVTLTQLTEEGALSSESYGAISGPDGRFSIRAMKPERYYVSAKRNGFVYSPKTSPRLLLKPGEPLNDFAIKLAPQAVIAGHVVDEYGEPVRNARIEAVPVESGPSIKMSANDPTDDRGIFRMTGTPGKYYVKATYGRGDTTFYPAADSKGSARVVEVAAGHELDGVDIRLMPNVSLTITGTVTGLPQKGGRAMILLLGKAESRDEIRVAGQATAGQDGKFTAAGLRPGTYRLLATAIGDGAGLGPEIGKLRQASLEVTLTSADIHGVNLILQAGESIAGQVAIEGEPAKSAAAEKMVVYFGSDAMHLRAEVGTDGSFKMTPVFPDTYRLEVLPLPENGYVKSVKLGDTVAMNGMLDLSGGVAGASVKVTVSRNGGQIEGRVLGAGLPLVMMAATAAEVGTLEPELVGAGGKFVRKGLRPGKYRVIAVDGAGLPDRMETFKTLFAKAPEIEVHEGDRITQDFKVLNAKP